MGVTAAGRGIRMLWFAAAWMAIDDQNCLQDRLHRRVEMAGKRRKVQNENISKPPADSAVIHCTCIHCWW